MTFCLLSYCCLFSFSVVLNCSIPALCWFFPPFFWPSFLVLNCSCACFFECHQLPWWSLKLDQRWWINIWNTQDKYFLHFMYRTCRQSAYIRANWHLPTNRIWMQDWPAHQAWSKGNQWMFPFYRWGILRTKERKRESPFALWQKKMLACHGQKIRCKKPWNFWKSLRWSSPGDFYLPCLNCPWFNSYYSPVLLFIYQKCQISICLDMKKNPFNFCSECSWLMSKPQSWGPHVFQSWTIGWFPSHVFC